MGSKNRIAKEILPIILKDRKPNQCYVEPFVGGANLIDKVEGFRIGADLNPFVIEALKHIRDIPESLPDHVSEEMYQELKTKKELNGVTGWVGFVMSFRAKWFAGYSFDKRIEARGNKSSEQITRAAKINALKQSPNLKDCLFINSSYQLLDIPKNSIIYCDPPYEGVTKYKDSFRHSEFWDWVRSKSLEGHNVFVSEYNAPDDFICVWEKDLINNLSKDTGSATEKLFIFDNMY